MPRPDPLEDPRWSVASLAATAVAVVAVRSAAFAAVLLGALAVHEAAHRVVARRHGARVGWPIFLPAPVFVGTLGALLPVRAWPRSRGALLEVGAAGPVAGFVVAVAALLTLASSGDGDLSQPLLAVAAGIELSSSDPWGHGVWAVCLVTGMNLLPIGQLDGGHVAVALLGERARWAAWAAGALVVALGWWWPWWWLWLAVLGLLGGWRSVPVTPEPLPWRARLVAAAAAVVGVACFLPVPA